MSDTSLITLVQPVRPVVAWATTVGPDSIHGPSHWARVEANGLQIAAESGADPLVVVLFSLFHDCMRRTDGRDPKHGPRAAAYVRESKTLLRFLTAAQFEQLVYACANHTREIHNSDRTIGTCYDADRLDLPRVGIVPNPRMLNTSHAKVLARRLH